jgi:tetratricopeptide (TPR) repeat protein
VRKRTLVAIVLTVLALPAQASDPPGPVMPTEPPKKPLAVDTLVAIADTRLEAALDETTSAIDRENLLAQAHKGYETALEREPKNKVALRGLAQFYARTDNRDKALETYKKYLALYPDAEVAHELALAHARWKDPNGAVTWCEYALKIDPDNRAIRKTLGFSLALAGKWDDALAALCRVMPEAQARHNLAGLLDHMGKTDAAKDQFRLALKADPTYAPARDRLSAIERKAARAEEPKSLPLPQKDPTPAPAGTRTTATYKLRNVAAADAVRAVTSALGSASTGEKQGGTRGGFHPENDELPILVVEPVTNTVLVSAKPAEQQRIAELLAALDKEPQQVVAQVMVVEVPREFIDRAGLNVGGDAGARVWTLTPREVHMFAQLLRCAKEKGECDVLSRPQMQVLDGQTGSVHVGQALPVMSGFEVKTAGGTASIEPKKETVTTGVTLKVTPRVAPDNKTVRLRAEFQLTEQTGEEKAPLAVAVNGEMVRTAQFVTVPTFTTQTARATAELKLGHTMVLAAERPAPRSLAEILPHTGTETLVLITVDSVRPQEPVRRGLGGY